MKLRVKETRGVSSSPKQTPNAIAELRSAAAVRRERLKLRCDLQSAKCGALLGHAQEGSDVFDSSTSGDRHVVATVLAFDADCGD